MAREMKDSGIEWIGEIPKDWSSTKIKYFYNCYDGKRIPVDAAQREKGPYPYWGAGSITDYVADYLFDEELILLGEDGAPFFDYTRPVAFLINEKVWVNNHIHVLKPHNTVDSKFLVHWLNNVDYKSYINGSILNKLTQSNMDIIAFACPPLSEQRRISAFLDRKCSEIDSVIAKTQATIEEYKALKQSIITEAVTKGVRGERPMKDSGIEWIGEIPEEWGIVKGHRVITSTQNGLTRRDLEKSDGNIVLKLKNINANGYIDYSETSRITLTDTEISTYRLFDDDFLFVRVNGSKNLVGKCAIYHEINEVVGYNDHIIRVKFNELCDKEFIFMYLMSYPGKVDIELHTSTAAGQFTISGDGLRDLFFVLPSPAEQKEIVCYLKEKCFEINKVITCKEQFLTELESYKKSVIYEYVTGKKEVPVC